MQMYLALTSEMELLIWSFNVVKYVVGMLIAPVYYIIFPPAVSLVLGVSVF